MTGRDMALPSASATAGEGAPLMRHALQECLRSAVASVTAHGLRSFLTTLGIVIGVAAVICVVALVQGLSKSVSQEFQGLGGNMLTLRVDMPLEDALRGKQNRLRIGDLEQLQHRIDGISHITPIMLAGGMGGVEVRHGPHVASGQLFGTTSRYQDVQQTYPKLGRFIADSDGTTRRRVVVLGEQVRRDLKLPENPVGRFIQLGGEWFLVIGLMEARGELFGLSQDNYLVMPYETALAVTGASTEPDLWISFNVDDPDQIEHVKARVTALMRQQRKLQPGQPDDFVIESADALAKSFKQVSTIVTLVVAGIVGISLLVGGVGIMNIMLVSVTERTREIGIAKALGAPRRFILMQFLIEAVLLAVAGGLAGIVLGIGLSHAIAQLIPNFPEPAVPWWVVLGSAGFSGLVGVVFGILPASNAANLAPIDALRHE
ncbi:Macrolide export ATP-binding/permease protein MacB [Burkholderiaceae bacterium]|nr:Macrolide export ATP-binding/permease protein MacB [Burkholderiaceae bacterium]